jgi:FkbM family methyltransferase
MHKGVSIASFGINNALLNIIPDIKTIIDIGANIGQYALAAHRFYPNSQIYSFEPVPICYKQLQENTKAISNIHSYNYALGNQNREITFFQNAHTHASSALNVSKYQMDNVPKTKNFQEIKVKCLKLDDFPFEHNLLTPILLKLDVQGYERNVLEGASSFLQKVNYIILEMSFIAMYDNEPLFDEMHSYLKEKGFKLVAPIGALPDTNLAIPQLDMLYKRISN